VDGSNDKVLKAEPRELPEQTNVEEESA